MARPSVPAFARLLILAAAMLSAAAAGAFDAHRYVPPLSLISGDAVVSEATSGAAEVIVGVSYVNVRASALPISLRSVTLLDSQGLELRGALIFRVRGEPLIGHNAPGVTFFPAPRWPGCLSRHDCLPTPMIVDPERLRSAIGARLVATSPAAPYQVAVVVATAASQGGIARGERFVFSTRLGDITLVQDTVIALGSRDWLSVPAAAVAPVLAAR